MKRCALVLVAIFVGGCESAEERARAADREYVRGRVAVARVAGTIDVDTMREVQARCARMKAPIAECTEAAKYVREQKARP